jgi:hypothetical protein
MWPWLKNAADAVIKIFASTFKSSEADRIATFHVAEKLLDKVGAGELADIAAEAKEHEQRRMRAATEKAEADVREKDAAAFKTTTEGLKTLAEAMDIANRKRAAAARTPEAPEAVDAFETALSRLRQYGGALLVDTRTLREIVSHHAGALTPSRGETEREVAKPGVRATVDLPIPISGGADNDTPEAVMQPASLQVDVPPTVVDGGLNSYVLGQQPLGVPDLGDSKIARAMGVAPADVAGAHAERVPPLSSAIADAMLRKVGGDVVTDDSGEEITDNFGEPITSDEVPIEAEDDLYG